mgnify:CR=1 FL=1
MSSGRDDGVNRCMIGVSRFWRAVAFVSVLLIVVVLGDRIAFAFDTAGKEIRIGHAAGYATRRLLEGSSTAEVVDSLVDESMVFPNEEGSADASSLGDMSSFVNLPEGARNIQIDEAVRAIGYECQGSASDAVAELRESMNEAGWSASPLGSIDGLVFTREVGEIRCMVASVVAFGDWSSVVIQTMGSMEK